MLGTESGCSPVKNWHPLPRWFRSAAATLHGAVLLETAKFDAENFHSFLFVEPAAELMAWTQDEVDGVFTLLDEHLQQGRFVAGFVSYECGVAWNRSAAVTVSRMLSPAQQSWVAVGHL